MLLLIAPPKLAANVETVAGCSLSVNSIAKALSGVPPEFTVNRDEGFVVPMPMLPLEDIARRVVTPS
jgi:hypothetical protein